MKINTIQPIILFDGVCNLCQKSVQTIIKLDKKSIYVFASLQSDIGQKIVQKLPNQLQNSSTIIVYYSDNECFIKYEAIINILISFGGWFQCAIILKLIPKIIGDKIYDFIAKNRHKWFGISTNCLIPTPEIKVKFLD